MGQCSYIMCDGYRCSNESTETVEDEELCGDHAEAVRNGYDISELYVDMEETEGYDDWDEIDGFSFGT